MRKFADNMEQTIRQTIRQTDVSTTESTLILSGSSPDTRGSWPTRKTHKQRNKFTQYWVMRFYLVFSQAFIHLLNIIKTLMQYFVCCFIFYIDVLLHILMQCTLLIHIVYCTVYCFILIY